MLFLIFLWRLLVLLANFHNREGFRPFLIAPRIFFVYFYIYVYHLSAFFLLFSVVWQQATKKPSYPEGLVCSQLALFSIS